MFDRPLVQSFIGVLILSIIVFSLNCGLFTPGNAYYLDSVSGSDDNSGTSKNSPWQSLSKVSSTTFQPGDNIYFKCGSNYTGCVTINGDGTAEKPITISTYEDGDAPRFSNPDYNISNGNALQVMGDYQKRSSGVVQSCYYIIKCFPGLDV